MAKLVSLMLLILINFTYPVFILSKTTPSISSTASKQLMYWSENVHNNMPAALLSKLSPLNNDDSEFFTSLISKQSFSSNAKFCSLANLACYSEMNSIKPLVAIYQKYEVSVVAAKVEKIDPFSFFRISILKNGNRVHLINLVDQFPERAFLPSQMASKISLNENDMQRIFPQSFINPTIKGNVENTLLYCNAPALKGEIKSCPKSLEDMIEFSKTTLGSKQLVALTAKNTNGSGKEVIIGKIKKINANKVMSCHEVFLPFATYLCHMISSTQIYAVDAIEPETKVPVNTLLAVCHMDTSSWPSNHPAFEILKATPGNIEACHWLTERSVLWIGAKEDVL